MLYNPDLQAKVKHEPWQEILIEVADLLEREGWCQGGNDRRCIIRAISELSRSSSAWSVSWPR